MSSTANAAAEAGDEGFAEVITRIWKDPKFRESCDEAFGAIAQGVHPDREGCGIRRGGRTRS